MHKFRNRMRDEVVKGGFYYGKREKMPKSRNRMRDVAVNWGNAITEKGRKCINFVIESSVDTAKKQFYYEKREKVHKTRNRKYA